MTNKIPAKGMAEAMLQPFMEMKRKSFRKGRDLTSMMAMYEADIMEAPSPVQATAFMMIPFPLPTTELLDFVTFIRKQRGQMPAIGFLSDAWVRTMKKPGEEGERPTLERGQLQREHAAGDLEVKEVLLCMVVTRNETVQASIEYKVGDDGELIFFEDEMTAMLTEMTEGHVTEGLVPESLAWATKDLEIGALKGKYEKCDFCRGAKPLFVNPCKDFNVSEVLRGIVPKGTLPDPPGVPDAWSIGSYLACGRCQSYIDHEQYHELYEYSVKSHDGMIPVEITEGGISREAYEAVHRTAVAASHIGFLEHRIGMECGPWRLPFLPPRTGEEPTSN